MLLASENHKDPCTQIGPVLTVMQTDMAYNVTNINGEYNAELEAKKEVLRNQPKYSIPVKIGNWNDNRFAEEDRARVTRYKKDHCQLLIQKTRAMLRNVLKPIDLVGEHSIAYYGDVFQIMAPDVRNTINPVPAGKSQTYGLYLSAVLDERDIEYGTHFMHGCRLMASPDKIPCVRNTFVIAPSDASKKYGDVVNYGDDIYIRIHESGLPDQPLFIQCEQSTYDNFGAGYLTVRLSQTPDIYCRFKILHWNPAMRYETFGSMFTPGSKVVLQHSATGQNLAVHTNLWTPTFFGAECVVSCHSFRDTHRMETAENMWKIQAQSPPNMTLFIRAAKGEKVPEELLEEFL